MHDFQGISLRRPARRRPDRAGSRRAPPGVESQDLMAVMIRTGTRHYSADLPTLSPLSEDEALTMTMPVYVAICPLA